MIRNLAVLAADFARHNSGILRARAAYAEQAAGLSRCKRNHVRPIGGRCAECDAETQRRYLERRAAAK